jgi:hypothetical protein
MNLLSSEQRNYYYVIEAERVGIHKSLLAALHYAHGAPNLKDQETGLGIWAVNVILQDELDTFPEQVQYAANTIRALTDHLINSGWKAADLWNVQEGRYSDRFLEAVANGYTATQSEPAVARLASSDLAKLSQEYLQDIANDYQELAKPANLGFLDPSLLALVERIPNYYQGFPHQRDALLECFRIWRKLDSRNQSIEVLIQENNLNRANFEESQLDPPLKQFIKRISRNYGGFPHQREALIRLTQLWRQLDTREQAIASLQQESSPEAKLSDLDPALISFVERVPKYYEGKGTQRNAMTEALRLWRSLDSRSAALASLGVNVNLLNNPTSQQLVIQLAQQIDQELLKFVRRVPNNYEEQEHQREALIRLVQLWRDIKTKDQAIESLLEDLKSDKPDPPTPPPPPPRPARWTPNNIQLSASIIPNGNFTWAEATHGGTRMPLNQNTVDAMIRIAKLAQQARNRLDRAMVVTSWYRPPQINRSVGGSTYSRHLVGDGMDFICHGLSGNQIYWSLDPWWTGGLGRYRKFPNLCHIDARGHRARWTH